MHKKYHVFLLRLQITAAVEPTLPRRTKKSWLKSAKTTSAAAHRVSVCTCLRPRVCVFFVKCCADILFYSQTPGDCCIPKADDEISIGKEMVTFACSGLRHGTRAHMLLISLDWLLDNYSAVILLDGFMVGWLDDWMD